MGNHTILIEFLYKFLDKLEVDVLQTNSVLSMIPFIKNTDETTFSSEISWKNGNWKMHVNC